MAQFERESLRARRWVESRLVRECIEREGVASYTRSLANLSDAFRLRDRALRCIDGRTPGGVRLAGSGIRLGLEKARALAELAQVERVTYHEDCGAARAWAADNGRPVEDAPACGREFAERLAAALGVPCGEAPLDGVSGFHDETVVYYDGTGRVDPSRASGLPKGYVVSRAAFGEDYPAALEEVRLAVDLSLSDLGFADLFTLEHPLRIVALGHPQDARFAVQQLRQELTLLELPERVVVDGFTGR
jgi:hypothetical protein